MKYRAATVTIEGQTKWAVFSGKKYFVHTVTDSKAEAEQQAGATPEGSADDAAADADVVDAEFEEVKDADNK